VSNLETISISSTALAYAIATAARPGLVVYLAIYFVIL